MTSPNSPKTMLIKSGLHSQKDVFFNTLTPRSNQQIAKQMGDENTQTFQVEVVILIKHQILITNLQGNVWQREGRINDQILGVKGLKYLKLLI